MKKPGHHALRIGRHSSPGQVYLVTFSTKDRTPIFADHEIASSAVECMLHSFAWQSSSLMHWVLMPDHWHGLIALGEDVSVSSCVARLKGGSARFAAFAPRNRKGLGVGIPRSCIAERGRDCGGGGLHRGQSAARGIGC